MSSKQRGKQKIQETEKPTQSREKQSVKIKVTV